MDGACCMASLQQLECNRNSSMGMHSSNGEGPSCCWRIHSWSPSMHRTMALSPDASGLPFFAQKGLSFFKGLPSASWVGCCPFARALKDKANSFHSCGQVSLQVQLLGQAAMSKWLSRECSWERRGPKLQTIKLSLGSYSIPSPCVNRGMVTCSHPFQGLLNGYLACHHPLPRFFPQIQAAHQAWKAFEKILGNSQPMHWTWGAGRKSPPPHQWFCWSWGQSICMWPSQAQALTAGCRRTLPKPCGNFLAALQNSQLLQELQLQDGCNHQVWPGWRAFALPLQRACHVPKGTIAL